MELFTQIAQLLLCLSILVILHEAGHFFAAKFFKTKVEKFYLFFDPWFSLFKKKIGDTEYGIGWLPLGGYVKIAGMIDESMDTEQMKKDPQPWEYRSKPAWQRLIIILAGIIVNIILAIIIYAGLLYTYGVTKIHPDKVTDGYVFSKPAQSMGFKNGDNIIRIDGEDVSYLNKLQIKILLGNSATIIRNGKEQEITISDAGKKELMNQKDEELEPLILPRTLTIVDSVLVQGTAAKVLKKGDRITAVNNTPVNYLDQLQNQLKTLKKDTVTINIIREGKEISEKLYIPDSAKIGIAAMQNNIKNAIYNQEFSLMEAVAHAPETTWGSLSDQVQQFKLVKVGMLKKVSGPLRLYKAFAPTWDWRSFWSFTAMFSIWLAFLNILPIPGLDGGHALFILAEMITGRKLSDKAMEKIQTVGVIILLGLMVLVFGNDIWNIFQNLMGNK